MNISIILPLDGSRPSIDEGYRLWVSTLAATLSRAYGIEISHAPVQGAFCPGSYDVTCEGRKLAGIAQARRRSSVLIHGTILVDVDRDEYLGLVAAAERRTGMSVSRSAYDPSRIVSLRELAESARGCEHVARALGQAHAAVPREPEAPWEHVTSHELARAREIAALELSFTSSDDRRQGGATDAHA